MLVAGLDPALSKDPEISALNAQIQRLAEGMLNYFFIFHFKYSCLIYRILCATATARFGQRC